MKFIVNLSFIIIALATILNAQEKLESGRSNFNRRTSRKQPVIRNYSVEWKRLLRLGWIQVEIDNPNLRKQEDPNLIIVFPTNLFDPFHI